MTDRDRHTDKNTERDRERQRQADRQTDRIETQRHRDRQRDSQTERQTQRTIITFRCDQEAQLYNYACVWYYGNQTDGGSRVLVKHNGINNTLMAASLSISGLAASFRMVL